MNESTDAGLPRPICWIGGSKGGVGKSIVTMAVLDWLSRQEQRAMLIECDTSNADVWKAYGDHVPSSLINLDEADGWIELVNVCDAQKDSAIVVNTAARNNTAVIRYGQTLDTSLADLGRPLLVLWVINRQRDSLELLREFVDAMPHAIVHVVRNAYFGEEKKFELYNSSKVRHEVEQRGGKSITFPDLADRVADDLYTQRLAVAEALRRLPLGNRAELTRWRSEVADRLAEVLG